MLVTPPAASPAPTSATMTDPPSAPSAPPRTRSGRAYGSDPAFASATTSGHEPPHPAADRPPVRPMASEAEGVRNDDGKAARFFEARLEDLLLRAQAELVDVDLFAPIPPNEDCPICFLPLPLHYLETKFRLCCGKVMCGGCHWSCGGRKCPFCNEESLSISGQDKMSCFDKLMERGNQRAYMEMARNYCSGSYVEKSYERCLDMCISAGQLGDAFAFLTIAWFYQGGFVVGKCEQKWRAFLEVAAKKGCAVGQDRLADLEMRIGSIDEAIRHWRVAASAGYQHAMDELMHVYRETGLLSKEDLDQTLCAFQQSNDEMKSENREKFRSFCMMITGRVGGEGFLSRCTA